MKENELIKVKRALVGTLAAVSLATTGLVATSGTAIAQGAENQKANAACSHWSDSRTHGAACSSGAYSAYAKCTNGRTVYGDAKSGGRWSYAYCSTVGSYLRYGGVIIFS